MKLGIAALLAILVGAAVVLVLPRPREVARRLQGRHAFAARICREQGPDCHVLSRSLSGLSCVCR